MRPSPAECGSPRVTVAVGPRGRGLGRSGRRRPPVRRLPGRSSGPFHPAAPGAGEAGLGAAAPRRPGRPGAPPHARTGGSSPPRAAAPAGRTHLASLTPMPTPSAHAQEEAAVPAPGRLPRFRLCPGEPGADGGRWARGAGGARRRAHRSDQSARSKWPVGGGAGLEGRGSGATGRGDGTRSLRLPGSCQLTPCLRVPGRPLKRVRSCCVPGGGWGPVPVSAFLLADFKRSIREIMREESPGPRGQGLSLPVGPAALAVGAAQIRALAPEKGSRELKVCRGTRF